MHPALTRAAVRLAPSNGLQPEGKSFYWQLMVATAAHT